MSEPVRQTITVKNENGLHLVPCSLITRAATGFACQIEIHSATRKADAKNIFDLMGLGAAFGTELTLIASGDGAADAIQKLVELFESGLEASSRRPNP